MFLFFLYTQRFWYIYDKFDKSSDNGEVYTYFLLKYPFKNIQHVCFSFFYRYEACQNGFMSEDNPIYKCNELGLLGIPTWFMYITPFVKFLQIFNAAINFPIYYFMGTSFRDTFHNMIHIKKHSSTLNGNRPGTRMR